MLELHSKPDRVTTPKTSLFLIRPCAMLSMSRKWLVFASQLPECNYLDSKSARPSRLGAKSNRTINQRGRTKRRFPSVLHSPHMVRRVHRRRTALSRLIYLARSPFPPLLSSLALTFGYKFLLCRGFRLPLSPFLSRSIPEAIFPGR